MQAKQDTRGRSPTEIHTEETIENVKIRLEKETTTGIDSPTSTCSEALLSKASIDDNSVGSSANHTDDDESGIQTGTDQALPSLRLNITQSVLEKAKRINETDTIVEVWDENESGLSWGHKKSKDKTWEEKWLQQSNVRRVAGKSPGEVEEVRVVFGQSSGINGQLHQRWGAAWESEATDEDASKKEHGNEFSKRNVKKSVRQYQEDMQTLIEEWDEEIEENSRSLSDALEDTEGHWTRKLKTIKSGLDQTSGRKWRSVVGERFKQTVDGEEFLDRNEAFEEILDTTKRSRYCKTESDGSGCTRLHISTEEDGQSVVVDEDWCCNTEGTKWGKKSGTKGEDETWESKWHERASGERELVEWKRFKNSTRGEKSGRSSDGEFYNERWEITEEPVSDDGPVTERRSFNDKWWTGVNGHKWGEKTLTTERVGEAGIRRRHVVNEKWYDNGKEKVVDNWKVDKEFDLDEGTVQTVRLVEHGYKIGNRYSDGTEWGETWGRVHELGKWKVEEDAQGKEVEGPAVVRTETSSSDPHYEDTSELKGLVLRIRHHDKWWKEPSGNRWGEKRYADLKLNEERNENWYNNCVEEQVDRWEINQDGTRQGQKFGKSIDNSREWKERWQGKPEEDFWIDKYWSEHQEGGKRLRWGETEGKEGGKKWKQKWGEDKNVDDNEGRKWTEKWDDDGFGNVTTLKEGEDWTGGGSVSRFSDKYGECLGKGEKWAVKKGSNCDGEYWIEKWNELPGEKRAEKEGKNRYGDEWREAWKENVDGAKKIKWAEKTGRNINGEEWLETWNEEGDDKKFAKKIGKNYCEEWAEQWGEELNSDGSGQKWTSKWARNRQNGDATGQSWGDAWGSHGGGRQWGEKWHNDEVDKWWSE